MSKVGKQVFKLGRSHTGTFT